MSRKISPQLPNKNFNKIVLIGESPGKNEEIEGKPFVGASGTKILDPILKGAGIDRYECLIDNLVRYRPDGDRFEVFEEKRPELLVEGLREMQALVDEYNPNIIVALGAKPLQYLTGVKGAISTHRGSVLPSIGFKRQYKVLATFHPAYIVRNYDDSAIALYDMRRVYEESKFPEIIYPNRNYCVNPTFQEVMNFFDRLDNAFEVSFDIETQRNNHISCFGFALSPEEAICVPIVCERGHYWGEEEEAIIWKRLASVLANRKICKIIHNFMFEGYMLEYYYDMEIINVFDTLVASHVLYPEFPHSLAFMTSILTKEPYYKDEGRGEKKTREDWTRHYIYNAKDCVTTFEIKIELLIRLTEENLLEVLSEEMSNALYATRMQYDGICVDKKFREEKLVESIKQQAEAKRNLIDIVGHDINPGSTVQLKKLLYEDLKLPKQYKTNTKGSMALTTDVDALNDLGFKFDLKELQLILSYRKHQTNKSFFNYQLDDTDGKVRISHNPAGQEGARWSTSKNPSGFGRNLQNLPKEARGQIVAQDGCYLLEIDLEQVESRFVAYYSDCTDQIQIFIDKRDIHAITAAYIFQKPIEECGKGTIERYLGKTANHSSNYGIGGTKFVRKIYKDTSTHLSSPIRLTPKEGQKLINGYHELYPEIKGTFHMGIQNELRTRNKYGTYCRTLTNAFGRKRHFWGRLDDANLLFEAYNYKPQSGTAMIINKVINSTNDNLYDEGVRTLLHTHDGCLFQIPKTDYMNYIHEIYSYFNIPITIGRHTIAMPAEISMGERWEHLEEVKL